MTSKEQLLEVLTPLEESFYWKKHELTVIGDGHLDDGTRVHMVMEEMEYSIMHLSNAYVVSLPMIINEDIAVEFENYKGIVKGGSKLPEDLIGCIREVLDKYKQLGWIKK